MVKRSGKESTAGQGYTLTRFPSGLQLVTVPMGGIKSVTILCLVGIGSRYEVSKEAGIAHFLEHMVFKGTQNYPTAMDISSAIDSVGGEHNAFTSKDYTGYYVKLSSEHLDLGLDVISDMLLTPILRQEDIDREKGVIVEEINMHEDEPRWKISDVYDTVVYGKSPLGREIIGSKETVKGISARDLERFLDQWYDLSNVVLVVAGDGEKINSSAAAIQEKVRAYFRKGKVRPGGGKRKHAVILPRKSQVELVYRKTDQAHFFLGVPAFSRTDERRSAEFVLTTLLGGNSSARLFNEIREKRGLAYYAYASSSSFFDTGSVYAFEGVDVSRVSEAISLTLEQCRAVMSASKEGISEVELKRAKEYLAGKLVLDWEDSQNVALLFAKKLLLEGKVETPTMIFDKIKAVTMGHVVGAAKQLFDTKAWSLALIGPYKNKGRFEKLLK